MGSLAQMVSGTDTFNSQPLGEGFEVLSTSAGNRVVFRSPAEKTAWMLSPAGRTSLANSVNATDDGSFNDSLQSPSYFA